MDLRGEKLGRVAAEKRGAAGGTRDGCRPRRGGVRGGSRMGARTLPVSRLLSENQMVMRLVQPVWRPARENRRPLAASVARARSRLGRTDLARRPKRPARVAQVLFRLGADGSARLRRGRLGRGCGADGGRVSGATSAPGGGGDSPPRATPPFPINAFARGHGEGDAATPHGRKARRPPMPVAASGAPRMAIERLSEQKNGAPARAPKQGALRWRRH